MLTTIVAGILMMLIIITVHELGHLVAARVCGVGVEEFSIGFGWWKFKMFTVKGIPFYFRPILLGGFVRPKTKDLENPRSNGQYLEDADWKQKVFIFSAGILFNLAAAIILRVLMFWFAPADTQVHLFQLKISFLQISTWYLAPFYAIKMVCLNFASLSLATALGVGILFWKTITGLLMSTLTFFANPLHLETQIPEAATFAPIPNAGMVGQVGLGANAHHGFWSFVGLIYLVSIMIAALNILPLKPFDGGQIVVTLMERVFGNNRATRFVATATTYVGFLIVIVIFFNMLASDGHDIHQFFKK